MNDKALCELCGEPMPEGEEMFKYHGYSSNCPKPPRIDSKPEDIRNKVAEVIWRELPTMVGGLEKAYQIADKLLALDLTNKSLTVDKEQE